MQLVCGSSLILALGCVCKQIMPAICLGNKDIFVSIFHRSHSHDIVMFFAHLYAYIHVLSS